MAGGGPVIVRVRTPRRAVVDSVERGMFDPALAVDHCYWDGEDLCVRSTREDLTAAEQQDIVDLCESANDVEVTLRRRAIGAYQSLADFEALPAAQAQAQLVPVAKLLCKVARALIRLQLRRLDQVD